MRVGNVAVLHRPTTPASSADGAAGTVES
jgi:hypothetical protein